MWSRPRLGGRKLLIFRPKTSNPALSPALAAADISASAAWTAESSFVSCSIRAVIKRPPSMAIRMVWSRSI